MHKQVSGWTVNFGPNFPESPFLELKTRKPPPPSFQKTSDLGWPKFTLEYPPPFWKASDLGWPKFTPEYTPPILESFRFGMTKVYSRIPPISENFRFGMTKVYSGIPPPISENFRFGMTKVYSGIPPHFGKLQIWDDQSLLWNTPPPFQKASDLGWPKFTPEYPPNENCQRVQVQDFQNTESYYMWRLYPTRITTSFIGCPKFRNSKAHEMK